MSAAARRPLRVLLGMPFGDIHGGSERLLDMFLEEREAVGVEPHVVFLEPGPWADDVRARGMQVTIVEPGRFRQAGRQLAALRELRALMRREQPDVICAWLARAHVSFAPAAIAAGMRRRLAWYQWLVGGDAVERMATALPSQLVLTCSEEGSRAQEALWPKRPVHLAYPGIVPPPLLSDDDLAALRRELGIPASRTVVGISGRLVRWKHQDRVLRATRLLADAGHDVHALVLGGPGHGHDAGFDAELEALAAELGIADRVTFTGHRTDAPVVTQVMDISINASEPEPFGLVVIEALAGRRPVVAVNAGGPSEVLEDGVTGRLVPSSAPELLAGALAPLVADPGLRAAMGERGREVVLERFTRRSFAEQVRAGLDLVAARA